MNMVRMHYGSILFKRVCPNGSFDVSVYTFLSTGEWTQDQVRDNTRQEDWYLTKLKDGWEEILFTIYHLPDEDAWKHAMRIACHFGVGEWWIVLGVAFLILNVLWVFRSW